MKRGVILAGGGMGLLALLLGALGVGPTAAESAALLQLRGDTAAALAAADAVLVKDPGDPGALFVAACAAIESGDLDRASRYAARLEQRRHDPHAAVLKKLIERRHAANDLGLDYDLEHLGPPRNLTHLENYLLRSEWQYYKSTAREADFRALITFAQHDPRYLRAVARTSRKLHDGPVENHNLPMVLLFREALRLEGGDKKRAVGLLDETIRIPFGWVKSIPRDALPGSLALDNFLLPGNKEDGADKSRHWNVFGGICLYKSPQEALDLALKREMQDFRDGNYLADELREFFRDLIADLNGMYHVMTIDPGLLRR